LSGKALEDFLINFVVEQTGYPTEMVELDADLEADLGIDSIKKAQLFGELGEHFEVQVSEDMSLDDFPTLRHVMKFLDGAPQKGTGAAPAPVKASPAPAAAVAPAPVAKAPTPAPAVKPVAPAPVAKAPTPVAKAPAPVAKAPAPAAPKPVAPAPRPVVASAPAPAPKAPAPAKAPAAKPPAAAAGPADPELEAFLVNFVVEQTGYPTEMVELDADLEADLGIDSIKKAQLFGELGEYFEVQVSEDMSLDDFPTLRHVMSFLQGVPRKAKA
jgi:acyl carrier protein